MSSIEEEQEKQMRVKKDHEACDHVGYFVGFGLEVMPSDAGLHCVTAQNCMMCGEVFIKLATLSGQAEKPEKKESSIIVSKN